MIYFKCKKLQQIEIYQGNCEVECTFLVILIQECPIID